MTSTMMAAASVDALAPRLRSLDQRVLDALGRDVGRRAARVAQLVHGAPVWRCDTCSSAEGGPAPAAGRTRYEDRRPQRCGRILNHDTRDDAYLKGERVATVYCTGRAWPMLVTSAAERQEVREILRGLERTGYATCRGGWWRRV